MAGTSTSGPAMLDRLLEAPLSRRTVLGGLGLGALGLLLPGTAHWTGLSVLRPLGSASDTLRPYRLAMHVHASFSEGIGSMYAALTEARRTGHDLVFFTDHDTRKQGYHYRQGVHFKGLTEVEDPSGTWVWANVAEGSPVARSSAWVASPSSPAEPGHALQVSVTAPAAGTAANLFEGADDKSAKGTRSHLTGQRLRLDVRVGAPSPTSWLEVRCYLSYYPALGGFPAGQRQLVYRFGSQTGDERSGLTGIVRRAVPADAWTTVDLALLDDATRLFPELPMPADLHLTARSATTSVVLTVGAVAKDGAATTGWFDRLRYTRTALGAAAYDTEARIIAGYASRPELVPARLGDELSRKDPHLQWLTGRVAPLAYDLEAWPAASEVTKVIAAVHAGGGVLQYNHPFGAEAHGSFTDQGALLATARGKMLACGAWPLLDLLETGYQRRGLGTDMASLDTHLRLFDLMARSGRFVTATGCTDDHEGIVGSWSSRANRFATGVWARSLADADVAEALLRGRAWCLEVEDADTVSLLDLTVDDVVPMGSLSIATKASRSVQLRCPVLPAAGRAELIRGVVDYRNDDLTHRVTTFATATEAELEQGTVNRSVDTTTDCFVRAQVRDRDDRIVAFSNPIWLLRSAPAGACPVARLAPGVTSCSSGLLRGYGRFTPVGPTRILDTRCALNWPDVRPLPSGAPTVVQVSGLGGVPADAGAVAMNVTVTAPSTPAYLTVYPAGGTVPGVSNLNVEAGETAPNLVVARLGVGGRVALLLSAGQAHVLLDVVGWFGSRTTTAPASGLAVQSPERVLDTRSPATAQGYGRVGPGQSIDVQVLPPGTGATGVVLNLTATGPTASTYVTAHPAGLARPVASNLNLVPGQTRANLVIVGVSPAGRIVLFNAAGWVDLIADVVGAFGATSGSEDIAGRVVPLDQPVRIVDTRTSIGPLAGPGSRTHQVPPAAVDVAGPMVGAVVNLTALGATTSTYLTLHPADRPPPVASNVNLLPGQVRPNLAVVRLDPAGRFTVTTFAGHVHYLVDLIAVVLG